MFLILEERRKKMLQTMLIGIFLAVLIAFARDVFDYIRCRDAGCFTNGFMFPVNLSILVLSAALIIGSKHLPSWIPALIWQAFALTVILFVDSPEQLIAGKSSLVWVVAILPAAFIAHPNASFLTAGTATGLILWLSKQAYGQVWPGVNVYLLAMLWVIALLAWIAAHNMITAIKNAYTEQERLSAILENVADGIVVLGRDGVVLRANPVALNMLDGEIESLTRPAENTQVKIPDGRIISLNWAKVPDVGNVAVVRDVTREMEIARMKDAMLAVVSHELRTPLSGILGAAQLMKISREPSIDDMILGDMGRVVQIVRNLIDNAVKFTPEGSVQVTIEIEDALVMISIVDSGVGIPPQQLPDIWQPFRRASNFDTRSTQGVGLGLSIVHALVMQMNGDLSVQSKVGQGSAFYISLPLEVA